MTFRCVDYEFIDYEENTDILKQFKSLTQSNFINKKLGHVLDASWTRHVVTRQNLERKTEIIFQKFGK